jgi:hypothetical protein
VTIREGKWRCRLCSAKNRGSDQKCALCGWTRDDRVEFFLEDDAVEVTDLGLLARATAGPDWICSRCDNSNPAGAAICAGCGAAPEGKLQKNGKVVAPIAPPPIELRAAFAPVPKVGHPHPRPAVSYGAPAMAPAGASAPMRSCGCLIGALGAFAGILFFGCVLFSLGRTPARPQVVESPYVEPSPDPIYETTATVTSVAWSRTIAIEALTPTRETAWDAAPPEARDVSHAFEVHHTERVQRGTHVEYRSEQYQTGTRDVFTNRQIQTGTRDVFKKRQVQVGSKTVVVGHRSLGNGFFEDVTEDRPVYEWREVKTGTEPVYEWQQVKTGTEPVYGTRQVPFYAPTWVDDPVYREKYAFTVDRWAFARKVVASGGVETPAWPELTLTDREREGGRSEAYRATLEATAPRVERAVRLAPADFERFRPGARFRVRWQGTGPFEVLEAVAGVTSASDPDARR